MPCPPSSRGFGKGHWDWAACWVPSRLCSPEGPDEFSEATDREANWCWQAAALRCPSVGSWVDPCSTLTLDKPGYLTPCLILSFTSLKGVVASLQALSRGRHLWEVSPQGSWWVTATAGRLPCPEEIGGLGLVWVSAPRASTFSHQPPSEA